MARGSRCKVILIGNVGSDPDVRFTPSGNPVANLSIATDESYKDRQSGQMVPKTEWHRVVAFGKIAEIIQKYVKKGDKLYFEGRLQTRPWKDRNQVQHYTTEIIVDRDGVMDMMGGGRGRAAQSEQPAQSGQSGNPPQSHGGGYSEAPPPMDYEGGLDDWDQERDKIPF
jgi:single-strand DNA-binding protein